MINNTTFKKILRDYNYLYDSLIDIKDISSIAETEFREAMIKSGDNEAIKALIPNTDESVKIPDEKFDEKLNVSHDDVDFKKVFRKIVIKCHPDKIKNASESEALYLKECYEDATKSNDTYDWGLLIRVAIRLDVNLEGVNIQISEIKKKNEELQKEINKYENSMAFQWYTNDDTIQRENFLKYCLDVFKGL